MNKLVLIVEDNREILDLISIIFETKKIPCIFASNPQDAESLFLQNAHEISFIALDADLGSLSPRGELDTFPLARMIRDNVAFTGIVFVMSSNPQHNQDLYKVIGDRCIILPSSPSALKRDVIDEIVRSVKNGEAAQ